MRRHPKSKGYVAMSGFAALCLLLLQTGACGFGIFDGPSMNHQEITERAVLNTTAQTCRALALAEGKDFTFPPSLSVESVAAACQASKSSKSFHKTIKLLQSRNRRMDLRFFFNPAYHFHNEKFTEGKQIITQGLSAVKASNKLENFEAARVKLGLIFHTLQDFYSHSNWVEMGNKSPNSNLIKPNTVIGNVAAKDRETCRNCDGDNCRNNILEDILEEKILTSGYFNSVPALSTKPAGKCSHGGKHDKTSEIEPTGGINKDTFSASHGHLHSEAADLAIAATSELLEDVREAAGDRPFLQMMGISKGKALCFVIDTTRSMSDDIESVRNVISSIIDKKMGTEDEPSVYILVPFNDPDFGPLTRTKDPEVFKKAINSLSAVDGGDFPEMSLSGLQLALTGAPPNSEIYVFTDATAKDKHLKNTVIALIEQTKSVVNFIITGIFGFRRRRHTRRRDTRQQQNIQMVTSDAELYRDLADLSGGLSIEVTKSELLPATSSSLPTTSSSLVTLMHAARRPGKAEKFTFSVDDSVKNLIVYITGSSVTFTLISPSGVSQESTSSSGPLITASQTVGNFQTLQLKIQVGLWEITTLSINPYILKVVGESPIDFLFDFLEVSQGLFGGFDVVDNRPRAGVNGSLAVTVTGSDSATVTEVFLVESSGSGQVTGSVQARSGGEFLVHFDRIPTEQFVVLVKGQSNTKSSGIFQRQSTTNIKASTMAVSSPVSSSTLEPGLSHLVPFSVITNGKGGNFRIQATNDQGFTLDFPSTLTLSTGVSANSMVNLTVPSTTPSGTDVTLTIEVEAPGGTDINYVVLAFTVLTKVTDFILPVCWPLSLQATCCGNCSVSSWEISVQVTDGPEGTGIERVSLRNGNGTLNTSLDAINELITLVTYNASCCSPVVELQVVDGVGNVATCAYSIEMVDANAVGSIADAVGSIADAVGSIGSSTQAPYTALTPVRPRPVESMSTRFSLSFLLCFSITILGLYLPFSMGIN